MAMVAAGFSGGEAEELRRAFGFKRSEHRMQQIEGKLRAGMAKLQITGTAADDIIRSITSFALYGFPESHAASFALLVYASAYLKAHYPAAFYTALLNNQPMGFYHPATLVKDAQRHGVRFAPIDVQESDWTCRVDRDGRVRLGLMYVNGLRQEAGRSIAAASPAGSRETGSIERDATPIDGSRGAGHAREPEPPCADRCPKCGCDDQSMLEATLPEGYFCNICANEWGNTVPGSGFRVPGSGSPFGVPGSGSPFQVHGSTPTPTPTPTPNPELGTPNLNPELGTPNRNPELGTPNPHPEPGTPNPHPEPGTPNLNPEPGTPNPEPRYHSIPHLIACTRLRRDELATLADIGALNAFGFDRRSALWQVERAVRPAGELFADAQSPRLRREAAPARPRRSSHGSLSERRRANPDSRVPNPDSRIPNPDSRVPNPESRVPPPDSRLPSPEARVPNPESPLRPMTPPERLMADYAGTSLTIGPHPLALRRADLALRGVLRASDLPHGRNGRRVRIAGAVITRQRPGTAKGFVFLTLEDETGIANVIVRPDLFAEQRRAIVGEPYLLIEGTLQIQEGVTSVKAERVVGLSGGGPEPQSHDFR
jgi:hypothetical protein